MQASKKLASILILLGILAGLVYAFIPKPLEVESAPITTGYLMETITDEGKTRLRDPYPLTAPITGWLRRVSLEPGDTVVAGADAFAIEPMPTSSLDARAFAQATATVKALESRLNQAKEELASHQTERNFYHREFQRQQRLYSQKISAETALETAQLNYDRSQASVTVAQTGVDVIRFELANARAVVAIHGGQRLADDAQLLTIRSPVNGTVLQRNRVSEGVIQAGEPILSIGNLDELEVQVDVLSIDAVRLRPSMRVILEYWGGDKKLEGEIRRVDPAGFTRVSALGVDEQRVPVRVRITSPRTDWASLGEGFRVEARFVVWEQDDVEHIPTHALFRDNEQHTVYIIQEGRAKKVNVQPGRQCGLRTEILSGLQPDNIIIVRPPSTLDEGARVTPSS